MKFVILLIATTSVVRGYRHARYYESEYKMPHRYPRYGPPYAEQTRHYRDSFRQSPHPYLEEPNYREQPPPYREEKPYFGEQIQSYSDHGSYYTERQPFLKHPPASYRDQEPLMSYGNQQELNYNSFPPQPVDDVASNLPNQQVQKDRPRQSLSFGGHSSYLKFGNHALGFASVPIKSTSSDNNEIPSPSSTATSTIATTSVPVAHANVQNNTSQVLQSGTEMAQPMIESNTPNVEVSKNNVETSISPMSVETSKPMIMTPTLAPAPKTLSPVLSSATPIMMMPPQMKRLPFGISLPVTGFAAQNAYMRGGPDVRYNHQLEESKGYQPFEFQQSAVPEMLSYMLPPQQMSTPVKFTLPTLPISSLSASASSPLEAIKFVPSSIPKLTFINHGAIHPQTSLSLASAFPVGEFGQNTVQLGQIGQLDAQRQDVLQGLHLDLDGFGGIGGINYGAQASNSISKPAVLGIAKLGLSLPEASRSIIPTFTKIGFGQQLW